MSENETDLKFKQVAQSLQNTKAEIMKIYALIGTNADYKPYNDDGTINKPESISDNLKFIHEQVGRLADSSDVVAQSGLKAAGEIVTLAQFVMMFGIFLEKRAVLPPGSVKTMANLFLDSLDDEQRTQATRIVTIVEATLA